MVGVGRGRGTSWRAIPLAPQDLAGALGSSEDSALDNLWAALEQLELGPAFLTDLGDSA